MIYQEVPMPSDATYHVGDTNAGYYTGMVTNNSGHLRVTVAPSGVSVDYVRALLPADEQPGQSNRMVALSYTVAASTNTSDWSMAKLPDTGQTQSFTATFGEDSDYSVNPPSITDHGDGTVMRLAK